MTALHISFLHFEPGKLSAGHWAPAHRRLSFSARRREDSNLLFSIIAAPFCTAYLDSFASLG